MHRALPLATLLLTTAAVATACGSEEEAAGPPPRQVRLELVAPRDTSVVDDETVTLRGRVSPAAARVRVLGQDVDASGGTFETTVDLEPGSNLVDVAASADGRRPSLTALRVVRRMPVLVPDLGGEAVDAATDRVESLGLRAEVRDTGGLLDGLLPGDFGVCRTEPEAGDRVKPGTTVTVEVARSC